MLGFLVKGHICGVVLPESNNWLLAWRVLAFRFNRCVTFNDNVQFWYGRVTMVSHKCYNLIGANQYETMMQLPIMFASHQILSPV